MRQILALAAAINGFPRHLSQHVGGFVIARGQLSQLVPIENAAMPERTVIQWDKDDLDALGLLKVDGNLTLLGAPEKPHAVAARTTTVPGSPSWLRRYGSCTSNRRASDLLSRPSLACM